MHAIGHGIAFQYLLLFGNAFTKRYVNNPGLPQLRLRCDDLIQLLGRMLVTKSGPDTKVTKGRLSYCQQRFICSRWSESGFLNAKSSSAYNELALAGASSQRR